ncbi:MAG: HAD hydrolase-like protein, partial [Chloroflexi bacterium]|nr:HAD hydrolase-like protein [Chloroflexota bacterium]
GLVRRHKLRGLVEVAFQPRELLGDVTAICKERDFLQHTLVVQIEFEPGLTQALHEAGYVLTDHHPDYVVVGETTALNYERLTQAVRLVSQGARFIATNPDPNGPGDGGLVPACGAITAFIEAATGVQPYFIGKPNALMMRTALRYLNEHSENTIMVGDRMDTDIRVGTEAGLETVLVLTGVSTREMVEKYPYRPTRIVESVAELEME